MPGDPVHGRRVRGRGAADRRRGGRDDPHPRPPPGRHAEPRVEDYRAITEAIRAEVGDALIVNHSTGALGVPATARVAYVRALRPEVAALNMGSMTYAKYSARRRAFVFQAVFANPFDEIVALLEAMTAAGVRPEHECFDLGHVGSVAPLIDMGLLAPPLHVSFVLPFDRASTLGALPPPAGNTEDDQ